MIWPRLVVWKSISIKGVKFQVWKRCWEYFNICEMLKRVTFMGSLDQPSNNINLPTELCKKGTLCFEMNLRNQQSNKVRISSDPVLSHQLSLTVMAGSQDKEGWNKRSCGPLKFTLDFNLDEGQLFQSHIKMSPLYWMTSKPPKL